MLKKLNILLFSLLLAFTMNKAHADQADFIIGSLIGVAIGASIDDSKIKVKHFSSDRHHSHHKHKHHHKHSNTRHHHKHHINNHHPHNVHDYINHTHREIQHFRHSAHIKPYNKIYTTPEKKLMREQRREKKALRDLHRAEKQNLRRQHRKERRQARHREWHYSHSTNSSLHDLRFDHY